MYDRDVDGKPRGLAVLLIATVRYEATMYNSQGENCKTMSFTLGTKRLQVAPMPASGLVTVATWIIVA